MYPYVGESTLSDFQRRHNILIAGTIDKGLALRVMLLLKQMEEDGEPIWLIIDSPGGEVQAGFTIVDAIALCKAPVFACVYGEAASIAAVIFASVKRGNRYMLKHSHLMIHQPWSGSSPWPLKEAEFAALSDSLSDARREIEESLSESSGLPIERVHSLCERDFRMSAKEAIALGFADDVML